MSDHTPNIIRLINSIEREGECWIWQKSINAKGYGKSHLWVGGKSVNKVAHRLAYELIVGEIPAGLALDHLCGVRACVNPMHLEPVTTEENNRRMRSKRTKCKRGHELSDDNVYLRDLPTGAVGRVCKTCRKFNNRKSLLKMRRLRDANTN